MVYFVAKKQSTNLFLCKKNIAPYKKLLVTLSLLRQASLLPFFILTYASCYAVAAAAAALWILNVYNQVAVYFAKP